jgi:hypothetical protein
MCPQLERSGTRRGVILSQNVPVEVARFGSGDLRAWRAVCRVGCHERGAGSMDALSGWSGRVIMITVMITGAVADEPGAAPPGGRPPSSEPIGVRNLTSSPKGAFRATREPLRTPPSWVKCSPRLPTVSPQETPHSNRPAGTVTRCHHTVGHPHPKRSLQGRPSCENSPPHHLRGPRRQSSSGTVRKAARMRRVFLRRRLLFFV